jgi:hypothetical protein
VKSLSLHDYIYIGRYNGIPVLPIAKESSGQPPLQRGSTQRADSTRLSGAPSVSRLCTQKKCMHEKHVSYARKFRKDMYDGFYF